MKKHFIIVDFLIYQFLKKLNLLSIISLYKTLAVSYKRYQ